MSIERIRNFSIIAHVDHGKSTLADRLIEICGGLNERQMRNQVLDSMDIERERGITIKAQTVRLEYQGYLFNIVDTPGHVDFAYEVSRSLAACQGALLVVDATQGVEAQTIANAYMAIASDLHIIPVINKVDLPSADVQAVRQNIIEAIGIDDTHAVEVSAKTGLGIDNLLSAIIEHIPAPQGDENAPLCALLVDSWYDTYNGVVTLIYVKDGVIRSGQKITMKSTGQTFDVDAVGIFTPKKQPVDALSAGNIGYILAGIKSVKDCKVGDTITQLKSPTKHVFEGFRPSVPVVFCGIYPTDRADYPKLRDAFERLQLNDSAITFEPETNSALGVGFRCGCLGLLHLEVVLERLEREYGLDVISTSPSIVYRLKMRNGEELMVHNPSAFPDPAAISTVQELWINATIVVPDSHLGAVIDLCTNRRGIQVSIQMSGDRCVLNYQLPLAEVVYDFHDRLKSVSRGLASFDYEISPFRDSDVVRLGILINGKEAEALSMIIHRDNAEKRGRVICEKLKEIIPRQMIKIPLQAVIGGKVIARETVPALRKDVTAKCYGGDITRKRKLLEKQREGKKRMQQVGNVDVPKSAFLEVLRVHHAD